MYTEAILVCILMFFFGVIFGWFFKGLNPFKIILGIVLFSPVMIELEQTRNILYASLFGIGFASQLKIIRLPFDGLGGFWLKYLLFRARRKAHRLQKDQYREAQDDLLSQKEAIEADLKQQREEAEEDIRRQADSLKARAEAIREQEARARTQGSGGGRQEQGRGEGNSKPQLDPSNFAEACQILGISTDPTYEEAKRAYREQVKRYHPDRTGHLGEEFKELAEKKVKLINEAWVVIKKIIKLKENI